MEVQNGVTFETSGDSLVIPLLFRPAPPHVFVNQSQSVVGSNRVTSLRFFVSQTLRNLTADDNDLSALLQVTAGDGVLSDVELSSSRDTLTAVYTASVDEPSFVLRLAFSTTETLTDSATGDNFVLY